MKVRISYCPRISLWSKVHYKNDDGVVVQLREARLRHYYESRYDYRRNLIDWDYTMSLKSVERASVIHIKQYQEWRESGIAFEFGDQAYTVPNRTMASYEEVRKQVNHLIMYNVD